jgi:hypothetical protein
VNPLNLDEEFVMQFTLPRALLCAFLVLSLTATAQNSGPASNGDFQFGLAGAQGAIQYDARSAGSSAKGQMTFSGAMEISNEDVDGSGEGGSPASHVTMTVAFDCLRIDGNRAAMSGVVTSSSVVAYEGAKAVLAVEDNGEGNKSSGPDRFTWGLYRSTATTWTPSDAEVPGDNGAMFTWYASDSERPDDVPVPTSHAKSTAAVDCSSFPFGSYSFEDIAHGAGQIQVKP